MSDTTLVQPSEAKEFLEVVEALNNAISDELSEAQYYCEQYLQAKFGINPYVAPVAPAAPVEPATPAATPAPADPNAQPAADTTQAQPAA